MSRGSNGEVSRVAAMAISERRLDLMLQKEDGSSFFIPEAFFWLVHFSLSPELWKTHTAD